MKKIVISILVAVYLIANENEIGNKTIEKGFDFKNGDNSVQNQNDDNGLNYLKQILEENKKQTLIQKEILDLLKKQNETTKKIITLQDGTKCEANSTPECFDYGSLIDNNPEVNKVGVLKDFLNNPYDLSKASKYMQWYGKLLNHSYNVGNALVFATEQFGNEANPMPLYRDSFDTADGKYFKDIKSENIKNYILNEQKNFKLKIFIGLEKGLDIFSFPSLIGFLDDYKALKNIQIIYLDKETKNIVESGINDIYSNKIKSSWNNIEKIEDFDKKSVNKYSIYTSPSVVIEYLKDKDMYVQTIYTGKIFTNKLEQKIMDFFEYKKLINYKKLSDYQGWGNNKGTENIVNDYFKRNFDKEFKIYKGIDK